MSDAPTILQIINNRRRKRQFQRRFPSVLCFKLFISSFRGRNGALRDIVLIITLQSMKSIKHFREQKCIFP